ncbi:ThiF family adenylyltransferase [Actinomycetospora chiangmaiensis]|uniref:ThiF family adenylyltransferase n=1 Tax=Actinomycetospora chiangmaiensis TaxID=402650 RepID=UPI000373C1B5|nr:ThiF family adenylyltransferase [Actinomycetospora chiangmaiensis]
MRPSSVPPRLVAVPRWPDTTTARFGDDPGWQVDGVDPPVRALLTALAAPTPTASPLADAVARGARPEDTAALLADLTAAGLLRPTPDEGHRAAYVRVHGAGRLGVAIATVLARAGIGRVAVRAGGTVGPDDLGTGLEPGDVGHPAVLAAAAAVARADPAVAVAEPSRRRPELVVLTGPATTDPTVTGPLHARHQPHLAVAAGDPVGVVGPLVLPGRTSCLRCVARHRADGGDPCPPASAVPVSIAAATTLAGLVTGAVLAFLQGRSGLLGAADEIDAAIGSMRRRPCPAHPRCPCDGAPPRAPEVRAGENRGRVR